jgi:hypothetical protein
VQLASARRRLRCGEECGPTAPGHRCYALYEVRPERYSCASPMAARRTAPENPEGF